MTVDRKINLDVTNVKKLEDKPIEFEHNLGKKYNLKDWKIASLSKMEENCLRHWKEDQWR